MLRALRAGLTVGWLVLFAVLWLGGSEMPDIVGITLMAGLFILFIAVLVLERTAADLGTPPYRAVDHSQRAVCAVCEREQRFWERVTFRWYRCDRSGCGRQYCRRCYRELSVVGAHGGRWCVGGHGFSAAACVACSREPSALITPRLFGDLDAAWELFGGGRTLEPCTACGRTYCQECLQRLSGQCAGAHPFVGVSRSAPDSGPDHDPWY